MNALVAADLRAAADVLERDGWTQGDYIDSRGCKCVVGALIEATGLHVDSYTSRNLLAAHKAAFKEAVGQWPINYNDAPGRTAAEVIAALRAAADRAEADQ